MSKYIIDDKIFKTHFTCDLDKCKGACCSLKGAGGAPLQDEEIPEIRSVFDIVKKYLNSDHLSMLKEEGFLDGSKGNYSIKSVNDADCIFSFNEGGTVKCSFEKAFHQKEISFRKPISCHLFPIRIKGRKRNILKYEELDECRDALVKGAETKATIFEFSKSAITREFGEKFYDHFSKISVEEKRTY